MRRELTRTGVVVGLLVLAVLLLGRHGQATGTDGVARPQATPSVPVATSATATNHPSASDPHEHEVHPAPASDGTPMDEPVAPEAEAPAVWDQEQATAAQGAAAAAMTAFTHTDLNQSTWWAQLEPLLSTSARESYEAVDVRLVPAGRVTAVEAPARVGSDLVATVPVHTDVATYDVLVVRQHGAAPWLVERITPQEVP